MNKKIGKFTSLVLTVVGLSLSFFNNEKTTRTNAISEDIINQVRTLNGPVTEPYQGTYYNGITAKKGKELRDQLTDLIDGHTSISYSDMEIIYHDSDTRPDNTVWDIYADWDFKFSDTGNYRDVGDSWNKEHGIPQSWFGESSPMRSDAYHIYPSDGYINNWRGNYPLAEVDNPVSKKTYTFSGHYLEGTSTLGTTNSNCFSGTVFEPADCYKGDFARSYFYFATRYANEISSGKCTKSSEATKIFSISDEDKLFHLTERARNLYLKWHHEDPVSQKEVNRCNGIQLHQKNRNPFIDHPEMVDAIWGDGEYTGEGGGGSDTPVTTPVIEIRTQNGGSTPVTLTANSIELTIGDIINVLPYVNGNRDDSVTHTIIGNNAINRKNLCYTYHPVIEAIGPGTGSVVFTKMYDDNGVSKTVTKTLTIQVKQTTGGGGGDGTITPPTNITGYTLIKDVASLANGDFVVLSTDIDTGTGVKGLGSGTASHSKTKSEWFMYYVEADSSNHYLFDYSANNYITGVSSNTFSYGEKTNFTTNEDGVLKINNRYLCLNGSNARFYQSIDSKWDTFKVYKVETEEQEIPPVPPVEVTLINLSYEGNYQTNYYENETFNYEGLTIYADFSDGTKQDITSSISFPTNLLTTNDQFITISYEGKSISLPIIVTQREVTTKTLVNIESEGGYKKEYLVGEVFEHPDLIIYANYSDGSTEDITEEVNWPTTPFALGDDHVTITFGDQQITYEVVVKTAGNQEEEPEIIDKIKDLVGCQGSAITTSLMLSIVSVIAVSLLLIKKENK